jgi:hypothetical protein
MVLALEDGKRSPASSNQDRDDDSYHGLNSKQLTIDATIIGLIASIVTWCNGVGERLIGDA